MSPRLLSALLACALQALGQEADPLPAHAGLQEAASCLSCHKEDGRDRWEQHRWRACTAYCLGCHAKAEMAQHHPVDIPLRKALPTPLPVAQGHRMTCTTCHDLSRPREDAVRWKAESLYGRLFRRQRRHRTYFLVQRNDRGQLCLICH